MFCIKAGLITASLAQLHSNVGCSPSAERHVSILDELFVGCHAATAPAVKTASEHSQIKNRCGAPEHWTAVHTIPYPHLHLANQPSKVIGSMPEFCCSFAAGVAGIQLYSMPQLASDAGEHPGACSRHANKAVSNGSAGTTGSLHQ